MRMRSSSSSSSSSYFVLKKGGHIPISMATERIAPMAEPSSIPWKLYHNPHFLSDPGHDSPHPVSDLALARAEIISLLTDLELERRLRREANSLSKSIIIQLAEERRLRAEAEAEAARCRDDACLAVMEMEEERRMLKYADALREERVQMKLADAAIYLEEKMREMAENSAPRSGEIDCISIGRALVDSPRAPGKAMSPELARERDRERGGGNLECQKAQLRALLRQKNGVDLAVVADAPSLMV